MHRRPSRKILWLAVLGIAAAVVLLGLSGLGDVGRILGALIALARAISSTSSCASEKKRPRVGRSSSNQSSGPRLPDPAAPGCWVVTRRAR